VRSTVAALTRLSRRWQATVVAAAFLTAAFLVASLVLVLLPDPGTAATHSGTTPSVRATYAAAGPGTPGQMLPVPGNGSALGGNTTTGDGARNGGDASEQGPGSTPHPASGRAPLAGRIEPGVTYRGTATFYGADGSGTCRFGQGSDGMVAALNHVDYESSMACGAYVLVRAANGASVTVQITDECAECSAGSLDLSASAFALLASPSAGRIAVTWTLLSPDLSGPVAVRYLSGSTKTSCALQVLNHRNPIARLDLRSRGSWRRLTRTHDDSFVASSGVGCGGTVRVTDIYGQHLVITGVRIKPGVIREGKSQFAQH